MTKSKSKARVSKNQARWHRLTIKGMMGDELVLMGHKRNLRLSIWCARLPGKGSDGFAFFTGEKTLKRLAREIMR